MLKLIKYQTYYYWYEIKNQKWINIRLIGLNEPNSDANSLIIQTIQIHVQVVL